MTNEPIRRLAAVFFADMVGFTALTAKDEGMALKLVAVLQSLSRIIVEQRFHGRIVKFIGDAVLAEFSSTDAAVRAAIALQAAYAEEAAAMGANPFLRTAVHLGEVIASPDGDIYGDGVNTASRLQTKAQPGQIIVSEDVWRQLRPRHEFSFHSLGELELRGVSAKVAVFDVAVRGDLSTKSPKDGPVTGPQPKLERPGDRSVRPKRATLAAGSALLLGIAAILGLLITKPWARENGRTSQASVPTNTPYIAVLGFRNSASNTREQEFADGMVESINAELGKTPGILLAASSAVNPYRTGEKAITDIARDLGVTAVLDGSARWAGGQVSVAAQLTDLTTGRYLWTSRYVRAVDEAFGTQDELARLIGNGVLTALGKASPALASNPSDTATGVPVAQANGKAAGNRGSSATSASPNRSSWVQVTPVVRADPTPIEPGRSAAGAPSTAEPRPTVPPPFTPVTDRNEAIKGIRTVLIEFASALAAQDQQRLNVLAPAASDSEREHWREWRGTGRIDIRVDTVEFRRFTSEGAEVNTIFSFQISDPPTSRPMPFRVLVHQRPEGWRIASLTRR